MISQGVEHVLDKFFAWEARVEGAVGEVQLDSAAEYQVTALKQLEPLVHGRMEREGRVEPLVSLSPLSLLSLSPLSLSLPRSPTPLLEKSMPSLL